MKSYAVVFTYSFDDDAAVYLFDTLVEAKEFLLGSFKEELRIDKEENGWNSDGFVTEDGMYAKIVNRYKVLKTDFNDVTEFHIANVYC